MKQYILGHYAANDTQLNVINKESNRRILDALRDAYPCGLHARGIEEKTGLPIKTVYACLKELSRELFVDELGKQRKVRGRPVLREVQGSIGNGERYRSQFIIEDRSRTYEINNEVNYAMAPGNVDYPHEFVEAWHTIVPKEEENELCIALSQFLDRSNRRISNHPSDDIRKWAPDKSQSENNRNSCCAQCGINHEARDFVRAMLLHLLDHLERHDKFIEFMKTNEFINIGTYQTMVSNIDKFQTKEPESNSVSLKQVCDHFNNIAMNQNISPKSSGCEECEKEGATSVGLRLCLTCGHVGCSDSSKGMHATKHFVNTNHPLIVVLPDRAWTWCYVHKIYG
jgi:ubiquitin-hydrolase Zn-finger-containing protein